MISDEINCTGSMEPEVVCKMDGVIIGGTVEKHLFLYTEKLTGSDSLRIDINIWQHELARNNRKSTNSSRWLFLSARYLAARGNFVIISLSFSPPTRKIRNSSVVCVLKIVNLLTSFLWAEEGLKQGLRSLNALGFGSSFIRNRTLYFLGFFGVWVILLYFALISNIGLISRKTSCF